MISKNQIKLITSLQQKKYRQSHQLFIAEGVKVIQELLLSNFVLEHLYSTEQLFEAVEFSKKTRVSEEELKRISSLSTANNCLALFKIPKEQPVQTNALIVALDDIRDPGNFGTIIRLCDWFGISQIVCSNETVDVFNPKVIQATMGSISRVNVTYLDLSIFLAAVKVPVFGPLWMEKMCIKKNYQKKGFWF